MKKDDFIDIIGDIDEKYISEAANPCVRRNTIIKYASVAACFALVITVLVVWANINKQNDPMLNDDNLTDEDNNSLYLDTSFGVSDENIGNSPESDNITSDAENTKESACNLVVLGKVDNTYLVDYSFTNNDVHKYVYEINVDRVYEGDAKDSGKMLIDMGFSDEVSIDYNPVGHSFLFALNKNADYMPTVINYYEGDFTKKADDINRDDVTMSYKEVMDSFGSGGWEAFVSGSCENTPTRENVNMSDIAFIEVGESFTQDAIIGYNDSVLQYKVESVTKYDNINTVDANKIVCNMTDAMEAELCDFYYANNCDYQAMNERKKELLADRQKELFDEKGKLREGFVFVLIDVTVTNKKDPEQALPETEMTMHYNYANFSYKAFPDYVWQLNMTQNENTYYGSVAVDENGYTIECPQVEATYWSNNTDSTFKNDKYNLAAGDSVTWQEGAIVRKDLLEKYGLCRIMGYDSEAPAFVDCIVNLIN